jgi:hypothetical protein
VPTAAPTRSPTPNPTTSPTFVPTVLEFPGTPLGNVQTVNQNSKYGKLEVQWGRDFDGGFVNGEVYWQQQRNRKGTTNNITTTNNTITSNNRWSL